MASTTKDVSALPRDALILVMLSHSPPGASKPTQFFETLFAFSFALASFLFFFGDSRKKIISCESGYMKMYYWLS